jgi:hypothetical protein
MSENQSNSVTSVGTGHGDTVAFFAALSDSVPLKFGLAWLTFVLLGVPIAILMSAGLPAQVGLPLVLVFAMPVEYLLFRLRQTHGSVFKGTLFILTESSAVTSVLILMVYIKDLVYILIRR